MSLKKNEQLSSSRYEKCNSSNASFLCIKSKSSCSSNGYHLFNDAVAISTDAVYTFHKCFQDFFPQFFFFLNSDWRAHQSHPDIPPVAFNSSQTIIIKKLCLNIQTHNGMIYTRYLKKIFNCLQGAETRIKGKQQLW